MSSHSPIRLMQACKILGWEGDDPDRRLLRALRAKERTLGVSIVHAIGHKDGGPGVRYRVTMRSIKRYCPEWFRKEPNEMLPSFRALLVDVKGKLEDQIDDRITPEVTELNSKIEMMAEAFAELRNEFKTLRRQLDGLGG